MDIKEALNIVKQACASVAGTLQTHQTIQQALSVIENTISAPKEKEGK